VFPLVFLVENDDHFQLMKEFNSYKLYKLLFREEYQDYLSRLEELFWYNNSPLSISDDNQSALYFSNLPQIVDLSNDGNVSISGNDSLKIRLSQYSGERDLVVRHQFPEVVNVSGFDFVGFYWYGQSSGKAIDIRLISNYPTDQYSFTFRDSWNGWSKVIIPLTLFKVGVGNPQLDKISDFCVVVQKTTIESEIVLYLDGVTFDKGLTEYYNIPLAKLQG